MQEQVRDVIRARKFELVDKKGKVRGAMEFLGDLAGLVLVGQNGKHRVGLWLNGDGTPSIGLKDADGRMAFMLTLGHGETRLLTMADKEGHVRLALSLTPDGEAEIHLISGDGKLRRITATTSDLAEVASPPEQILGQGIPEQEPEQPQGPERSEPEAA